MNLYLNLIEYESTYILFFTANINLVLSDARSRVLHNIRHEDNKDGKWWDVFPTDHPEQIWTFPSHVFNIVSESEIKKIHENRHIESY